LSLVDPRDVSERAPAEARESIWIPARVLEDDWSCDADGVWSLANPFPRFGLPPALPGELRFRGTVQPASLVDGGDRIRVQGAEAIRSTGGVVLERSLRLASVERSLTHAPDRKERVHAPRLTSDGFVLPPGAARSFAVQSGAGDLVRFTGTLVGDADRPGVPLAVSMGARVLLDETSVSSANGALFGTKSFELVVPPGVSGAQALRFENTGDSATVLIHEPLLVPADHRDRRAFDARPDLILVVVDTLRADALGAFGGPRGVTPGLDRLAQESFLFENAVASSSWTLPSHASIMTALHPHQHGATEPGRAVPEVVTIAEVLASSGYRTGAVTNGMYVSSTCGMDRGFQSFQEEPANLARTLKAAFAFMQRADDRPSFLFLHTYRVHTPYHAGPRAREAVAAGGGGDDGDSGDAVQIGLLRASRALSGGAAEVAPLLRLVREGRWSDVTQLYLQEHDFDSEELHVRVAEPMRSLYLAGVHELDDEFSEFLEELERAGLDRNLVLVLTSDHGEAFGDEGDWFHGSGVSRAILRVPLLIHGPGVRAGRSAFPASSVDLPRTLADLASAVPWRAWGGRALLDHTLRAEDAVALSFDCAAPDHARVCLTGPDWRILLPDRGAAGGAERNPQCLPLEPDAPALPAEAGRSGAERVGASQGLLDAAYRRVAEPRAQRYAPALDALGY
jgi:hypothetical protein